MVGGISRADNVVCVGSSVEILKDLKGLSIGCGSINHVAGTLIFRKTFPISITKKGSLSRELLICGARKAENVRCVGSSVEILKDLKGLSIGGGSIIQRTLDMRRQQGYGCIRCIWQHNVIL